MKEYKKFYEMDIWKEAYGLQKHVFDFTQSYPKDERFGLVSQTNDSANSVVANIAESHGRFYYADKIRVLYTVRGELEETQSHLMVAFSRQYINKEACNKTINDYENLKKRINNYINNLWNQKNEKDDE